MCVAFAYRVPTLQRIRPELMKVGTNDTNLYLDHIEKIGKTPTSRRSYMDTIENRKTAEERKRRLIVIGANLKISNHPIRREQQEHQEREEEDEDEENEPADDLIGWLRSPRRPRITATEKTSENGLFRVEPETGLYNFTKIGGYTGIKKELLQIVDMMRFPANYTQYNVRIPRGVLLEGPPGNGKTLLAKCFAGEAGSNFIRCSGAEFNEKYIGVGSSRLRELFKLATDNQPSVLFIDEFDAIGRKRGEDASGGERDTTLNQLLTLMDGFESLGSVLVMGATNRVDILDPAATRPGRFDKIIHVPNPDTMTRKEILQIHLESKPVNVTTDELVKMTAGFSGAMIENLLNEAILAGIRNMSLPVDRALIESVRQRMIFGVSLGKRNITSGTLRRIAVHEAGHLINAMATRYYEKPIKITIDTSDAKSLGMTVFEQEDVDDGILIRDYLDEKIRVLLGGRAAEEVIFGYSMSSGSIADLQSAFQLVKKMMLEFGMGEHVVYPFLSEEYKKRIDDEMYRYVEASYKRAKEVLRKNLALLDTIVAQLMEHKTLNRQEILDIAKECPLVL
jgi:cell division protease FtsH